MEETNFRNLYSNFREENQLETCPFNMNLDAAVFCETTLKSKSLVYVKTKIIFEFKFFKWKIYFEPPL